MTYWIIIMYYFLSVFSQQTFPSYHPVCPGDNVSTGSTALRWTDLLDPSAVAVIFREHTDIGSTGVVGIFIAELIGKNIANFELSSEASVQNIQLNNNGSSLPCSDHVLGGNMKTILILISGMVNIRISVHTTFIIII